MEKRPVAVFDIDGTIFRSSLLIELVNKLVEKGIFAPEARSIYEEERVQWLDRKGDYQSYITKVITAFEGHIKGKSFWNVSDAAGEVIETLKHRTYRYTRDLIADLKKDGYYLLAISHSPRFIADGFGYEAGFDKTYGTFYSTGPNDQFTGEIEDRDLIVNKAAVLMRAVRKENLTLEGSVGVGDTESDIPMLDAVETAIAFNPNAKLYKHAKRSGWKVVVERKDVIYTV